MNAAQKQTLQASSSGSLCQIKQAFKTFTVDVQLAYDGKHWEAESSLEPTTSPNTYIFSP